MDFFIALGIVNFGIVLIAYILAVMSYRQFTKGMWKQYTLWLVISATFMTIYLISFVIAKMGLYPKYYNHILLFGFMSESIAALFYIKSSEVLRAMANKFGFAHKTIHETLNLGKEEKDIKPIQDKSVKSVKDVEPTKNESRKEQNKKQSWKK